LKPSFSILELVIVIIIIGILASTIIVPSGINKLQLAVDTLEKYINFTHSLALKDDKYQHFPKDSSNIEQNRSKYWFKQWWQIRISKTNDGSTIFLEIFSDQPANNKKVFDKVGYTPTYLRDKSLAKDINGKFLIGNCGVDKFPDCNETNHELNLSKFGIKKVYFDGKLTSGRLMFDNFGNVFLDEGEKEDSGDINPLDNSNRKLLTYNLVIKLCSNNNCNRDFCKEIVVTPTGNVYQSFCK